MMNTFTDSARAVVRCAFGGQPIALERDILLALTVQPRGGAQLLLAGEGVVADSIPNGEAAVDRLTLGAQALLEAQRRGVSYIGTEHILLAIARLPGSALASRGVTAKRLDAGLSAIEADWQRCQPALARRLGAACRSAFLWLGGHAKGTGA